jgi:hypothetical protein
MQSTDSTNQRFQYGDLIAISGLYIWGLLLRFTLFEASFYSKEIAPKFPSLADDFILLVVSIILWSASCYFVHWFVSRFEQRLRGLKSFFFAALWFSGSILIMSTVKAGVSSRLYEDSKKAGAIYMNIRLDEAVTKSNPYYISLSDGQFNLDVTYDFSIGTGVGKTGTGFGKGAGTSYRSRDYYRLILIDEPDDYDSKPRPKVYLACKIEYCDTVIRENQRAGYAEIINLNNTEALSRMGEAVHKQLANESGTVLVLKSGKLRDESHSTAIDFGFKYVMMIWILQMALHYFTTNRMAMNQK